MHAEFTLLMSLALDGEATAAEMLRLQQHVRACDACADTWSRWQTLNRRLRAAPMVMPSVDLAARVLDRLEDVELRRRRARWVGSGFLLSWAGVVLAWVVVIALVALWSRSHPGVFSAGLAALEQFVGVLDWARRGIGAFLDGMGAPRLAFAFGALACCTCALGMAWLWLVGRSNVVRQTVAVERY